jgi:hypothetical protein
MAVVGVRTSGSYLAPLIAALLQKYRYHAVEVFTMRPGYPLSSGQRSALRALAQRGGRAVLTDDPPASGKALAKNRRRRPSIHPSHPETTAVAKLLGDRPELVKWIAASPTPMGKHWWTCPQIQVLGVQAGELNRRPLCRQTPPPRRHLPRVRFGRWRTSAPLRSARSPDRRRRTDGRP